jgi:hypothetical protein
VLLVITITLIAAVLAGVVYLRYERLGLAGAGMALLRTAGVAALALLLVNPARPGRPGSAATTVLLDGSLSMGARWHEARDSARALAGRSGTIFRFGARVTPDDTLPPEDGGTRLADALQLAQGRPGPIVLITDGEIEDADALEPSLLAGVRVVLLPRPPRPDAAVLDVSLPERLARGDSLPVDLTIATSASLSARQARLEVKVDGRVVVRRETGLPPAPGTAQRHLVVAPQVLAPGLRLVSVRVIAAGDAEPRDDERARWVRVAAQPGVVVLAAPAGWEMRFLTRELSDIAPGSVRGYAEIQAGRWVDAHTLTPVPAAAVARAAAGASAVVGSASVLPRPQRGQGQWRWLGADSTLVSIDGDWYPGPEVQPSPLAGRLSAVAWDSVPPLLGLVPVVPTPAQWVAVSARLGRRGGERPLVLGGDSAGVRVLATAGEGLWRWALRGGAAREAYRSVLAGGLDWLLGTGSERGPSVLTASAAVTRGTPVLFRLAGDSLADSLRIEVTDGRVARGVTLRFDAQGMARVWLSAGAYRWSMPLPVAASGAFVVEAYSDEFPPRPVTVPAGGGALRTGMGLTYARQRPWYFGVVLLALVGEWIWRHKRGLP